jgi:hypothetical protein
MSVGPLSQNTLFGKARALIKSSVYYGLRWNRAENDLAVVENFAVLRTQWVDLINTLGGIRLTNGQGAVRSAIWPLREKLIDSPRMRAASCGAWKPVEFSDSMKSR